MSENKTGPFDYLNAVNFIKVDIMEDADDEKAYLPFMVNRGLSYFPDTVRIANEMNLAGHLDHRLQFSFLINTIRKRKRFSKWLKPEVDDDLEVVSEYYAYSKEKARQVLPLLSSDQIKAIREKVIPGGRKRAKR